MNVFDYLFEHSGHLKKDFLLGNKETISYESLFDNSLKIASYLNENFGENKNILIISKNSLFFITAYLGILKSGNIAVPLDFSIEQSNFDYVSDITNSDIIFSEDSLLKKLNIMSFSVIIDENKMEKIFQDQHDLIFNLEFDHERLAELIFTSGSTGKPKGVMISHTNIISNTNSIIEYLNLTQKDIVLVVLPFYYCYGLSLLHTHLRVGGSIVINNQFMFLGAVVSDLKSYKCTGFSGVPSHFQMLLKKSNTFVNSNFPDLQYVTQAGGKLHDVFIKDFIKNFINIKFFIMYGQTEATARLSYLPYELISDKLGSIGKGIPGVQLKVVNKEGVDVKNNEVGEIIAIGKNIMMGYYKDDSLTKRTLKNGWLRTGDLAKKDSEGFIYIVGREKEILKVGGKRISPKEIEEVILTVPFIFDCTITGIYDDVLGESIMADVVFQGEIEEDELRYNILKVCKEKLSLYKRPKVIQIKSKWSVKATGKKH